MTIDWTVNIGALLGGAISGVLAIGGTYGAMLRFWHKVDKRIEKAEATLEHHAAALSTHGAQATRHESMLIDVLQDVARIMGQLGRDAIDATTRGHRTQWNGLERRKT